MSSSYELILASASLVSTIDENNGWVGPDLDDELDKLLKKFDDKVKACLYVARKMESEENDLRSLEIKINKRRHAIKNQRERVVARVHDMRKAAEDLGEDFKVKNNEYSVYLRQSVSLRVDDDLDVVDVRFLVDQPPKVDKKKAKDALKKGEELAGLSLQTNTSLQWRLF
jgi:hypothetical protein